MMIAINTIIVVVVLLLLGLFIYLRLFKYPINFISLLAISFGLIMLFLFFTFYIGNFILNIPFSFNFVFFFIIMILLFPYKFKWRRLLETLRDFKELIYFILIVASAIIYRFLPFKGFMLPGSDAGLYVAYSKEILIYGLSNFDFWNYSGVINIIPPGSYLLQPIISKLFFIDIISAYSIIVPLIGSLIVVNIYVLIYLLTYSKFAAFISSSLFFFSSISINTFEHLYGELFAIYFLTLSLIFFLLFLKNRRWIEGLLFALTVSILGLTHMQMLVNSLIFYLTIIFFYIYYYKDYKVIPKIFVLVLLFFLLILPWFYPIINEIQILQKSRNSFADFYFGGNSDLKMVGYPIIILAFLGLFSLLLDKEDNVLIKPFLISSLIFLLLSNASDFFRLSGIREKRYLIIFLLSILPLVGFGIKKNIVLVLDNLKKRNKLMTKHILNKKIGKTKVIMVFLFIILLVFLFIVQAKSGYKHTKGITTYLSNEEYDSLITLKKLKEKCPETTILPDSPFSGFRYWTLAIVEDKVLAAGWQPNAIYPNREDITDSQKILGIFGYKNNNISRQEIENLVNKNKISYIILHKNNLEISNFILLSNLYDNVYENNQIIILKTNLCGSAYK